MPREADEMQKSGALGYSTDTQLETRIAPHMTEALERDGTKRAASSGAETL